ncbi:MAG: hypothetical protein ACMXYG_01100 [Candidatus Woesearchaeota archaeon]
MSKYVLFIILIFTSVLVYSPHFDYKYPFSIDEWHHITEAYKLRDGVYTGGTIGYRFGFHFLLAGLSYGFDLVRIYHLLPALWVIFSALSLYYVISKIDKQNKKKTAFIALASLFFFASIKSSVNILGLIFFTPLSFSIPFIYLYIYWFYYGLKENKFNYVIYSLVLMLFLVFVYPISVLFGLPILIVLMGIYYKNILPNIKYYSLLLILPLFGFVYYLLILEKSVTEAFLRLFRELFFWQQWEGFIYYNSPLELYSLIGYIFALIGLFYVIYKKEKNYYLFVIWFFVVLGNILFYIATSLSILSPYKRNLYYFALVVPIFSAIGLWYCFNYINGYMKKFSPSLKNAIFALLFVIIFILTFFQYFNVPWTVYYAISDSDHRMFTELADYPYGLVLTDISRSMALYPIAKKDPAAAFHFYGTPHNWADYVNAENCDEMYDIIKRANISYIIDDFDNGCNWPILFKSHSFVYDVRNI